MIGFASKVMRQRDYGYAVRCEAVALPRRQADAIEWGLRPETFFSEELLSSKRGRSPDIKYQVTAGQSRRRTSDGEAEIKMTFEAKPK